MKLTHHGEGACVQMADHVAAIDAKDEQIRQLREALQEYKRNCLYNDAKPCDLCQAADALLEATK